jgi:hypothetical protein
VIQDHLHQFTRIDLCGGPRPFKALRGGELTGGAEFAGMAPQVHKSADRTRPAAQLVDRLVPIAASCTAPVRFVYEPLHEHAGFHVAETARQGVIVKNGVKYGFGQHQRNSLGLLRLSNSSPRSGSREKRAGL